MKQVYGNSDLALAPLVNNRILQSYQINTNIIRLQQQKSIELDVYYFHLSNIQQAMQILYRRQDYGHANRAMYHSSLGTHQSSDT